MKSLGIFCLIWITLLSVWPCGDTDAFELRRQDNQLTSKEKHQADEDCSPMCACMCCKVLMDDVKWKEFTLPTLQKTISEPQFTYVESSLSVLLDIWQPPKLG